MTALKEYERTEQERKQAEPKAATPEEAQAMLRKLTQDHQRALQKLRQTCEGMP